MWNDWEGGSEDVNVEYVRVRIGKVEHRMGMWNGWESRRKNVKMGD